MDLIQIRLENLNQAQQQAVTHELGNLLVLAGAGSGKTRVLVNRFAWLLSRYNIDPYNIMVVTFTNKAAKEMSIRLNKLNLANINSSWIGTFHGVSHKFLRLHYSLADLNNNFEVIDSEDQLKIIRRLIKQLNLNEDLFEAKRVQNFINRQKDHAIRSNGLPKINTKYDRVMFDLYSQYENICKSQNIIDFSELILRTYELLKSNSELLQHYKARFKHFLIDEFQDTNPIQYDFLKLLGGNADSVTAVGDDDQSIYGWRGAKVENILKYTKEFQTVELIRLEKNYRSTKTILSAANSIINNNPDRMGKTLWTDALEGEKIVLYGALNEEDEALFIVQEIQKYLKNGGKYRDVAVLYRSNAQSRAIEESLVKHGVNYIVYGGVNFFERAEIKDVLAYLRLSINEADDAAFERIINTPIRGIGDKTLDKIKDFSNKQQISYLDAAKKLVEDPLSGTGVIINSLNNFINIINEIKISIYSEDKNLTELVEKAIKLSGLLENLQKQKDPSSVNRMENLQELVNATAVFNSSELEILIANDNLDLDQKDPKNSNLNKITALLDYAALEGKEYAKQKIVPNSELGNVQLMTLHSAKGLEFPLVFLCGLEEGLFPHYFSKDNPDSLNEERRLCYVGITRSMQKIFISYAQKRRLFGREEFRIPSRFIAEIPNHLIEERKKQIFISINKKDNYKGLKQKHNQAVKKVRHNKFGVGIIIDRDGSGDKTRINVDFGVNGIKWLLLSHASLEVLN
ncbi:MAG: UvrD-helicase domain-containing protein, partial [Gammaproteobacteria bacterium]